MALVYPPDKLPKIFDPFYTSKPKGKGTGLGLSVSFGIIKEHGGEIYAESSKQGGARFYINLPIKESSTEEAPANPLPDAPTP